VNLKAVTEHKLIRPAVGAGLTVLCGLALWKMPVGERWMNVSYDYVFRFGTRGVTNKVVLILMDKDSNDIMHQTRGRWDRAVHAVLLKRLAADGCPLVVFDSIFREAREPASDQALAEAMRRQRCVVLMADQMGATYRNSDRMRVILPAEPFLSAAKTNCGVAWLDPDLDAVVRRHWPFPAPKEGFLSMPWVAAQAAGAQLGTIPQEQWLRYYGYGPNGAWTSLSYHLATNQAPNYFRDKTVFIGNNPETPLPDGEQDEFRTPYTRWTKEAVGGVEINATAFLNLVNGEWLRRPAGWVEALVLAAAGVLLGGALWKLRPLAACGVAAGTALAVTLGAVSLSYLTNYWFPWAVIAGGQVPCALAWALASWKIRRKPKPIAKTVVFSWPPVQAADARVNRTWDLPDAPDYELFDPPFAEGAYGKVWLARNAIGQWQALKAIYLAKFGQRFEPYEREFTGVKKYKPISNQHPGLLRVDFVSKKKSAGYFYYVMELGDGLEPGWEKEPLKYIPGDLARVRAQAEGHRLPLGECLRIGISLAEALEFLHRQGLAHRDIKPQNIIFVQGQPKLADVGLIADVLRPDEERTWVGTPGFMPPPPELPGTPQADIYGLGMVLYVIRTGREPALFPEVSTTLVEKANHMDFIRFNAVILKACQPDRAERYASTAEMRDALLQAQQALGRAAAKSKVD